MKTNGLFLKCLGVSAAFHLVALWMFYAKPFVFVPYVATLFGRSIPSIVIPLGEEDIAQSEKNIALEEAFNQMVALEFSVPTSYRQGRKPKQEETPYQDTSERRAPSTALVIPKPLEIPTDELPELAVSVEGASLFPVLEQGEAIPFASAELHHLEVEPPLEEGRVEAVAEPTPQLAVPKAPPLSCSPASIALDYPTHWGEEEVPTFDPFVPSSVDAPPGSPPLRLPALPSLATYGLPSTADLEWSDRFVVDVKMLQPEEEEETIFSVTFLPKEEMKQEEMAQHYYFLIDCGERIEKSRYATFKEGILRALPKLRAQDRFNIVMLDERVLTLSKTPLAYSAKTEKQARLFLDRQEQSGSFSADDVYKTLARLGPAPETKGVMTSVLLLSNGESDSATEKQVRRLQSYVQKQTGALSLYVAAVGQGNNLPFLDVLSRSCRGFLFHSDTYASFPRKFAKLVLDLQHPIGKAMTVSLLEAGTDVELYPVSGQLPNLFNNKPFTLYGKTKDPKNFTLLLQGENNDKRLAIVKRIDLTEVKKNSTSLAKGWEGDLLSKYEQFLKTGDADVLEASR